MGILLVVAIGLFFVIKSITSPKTAATPELSALYIQTCMEESIRNTIDKISSQGGYIENDLFVKFKFNDEEDYSNISYLCYINGLFAPCINQEPMLIKHLTEEIENAVSEDVEQCFLDYTDALEEQGYEVQKAYNGFNITLAPEKILLDIDGEITTEKSGETVVLKEIKGMFLSKFYDLAVIVQDIVNQESSSCNYEQIIQMMTNPDISIDKFRTGDSILIYRISHKKSKEIFKFAIRGCILPPGI